MACVWWRLSMLQVRKKNWTLIECITFTPHMITTFITKGINRLFSWIQLTGANNKFPVVCTAIGYTLYPYITLPVDHWITFQWSVEASQLHLHTQKGVFRPERPVNTILLSHFNFPFIYFSSLAVYLCGTPVLLNYIWDIMQHLVDGWYPTSDQDLSYS